MLKKFTYTVARLIAALLMFQTLYFKFTGASESIYIFETIGAEPWGRWLVGILELIASILLFIPRAVLVGGILTVSLMAGSIGMHLTVLGIEVRNDNGQLFCYSLVVFLMGLYIIYVNKGKLHKNVSP